MISDTKKEIEMKISKKIVEIINTSKKIIDESLINIDNEKKTIKMCEDLLHKIKKENE